MATLFAKRCHLYVPVRIDDEDAARLGKLTVSLGGHGYAQMFWDGRVQLLHRWILGLTRGDGLIGDHVNGDRLDNRRSNLRAVTPSMSSQNVGGRGRSKYRGVHPTRSGRWSVQVKFQGQTHYLGTYGTEEEAAAVADAKRRELMPSYVGERPAVTAKPDGRTHASRQSAARANEPIRAWAAEQGIELLRRGRIPAEVIDAYEIAFERAQYQAPESRAA